MERRKLIIYAIFVVTSAYGVYFHFLSDGGKKKTVNQPRPAEPVATTYIGATDESAAVPDLVKKAEIRQPTADKRSRNPFLKYNDTQAVNVPDSRPVMADRPALSAVSPGGSDAFVIANGRILKIGESAGVWKLLKAEDGKALFDGPGGSVWVKIGG